MANPNTKTISVTMWKGQAELLEKAADKAEVSVSEIIRSATIPAAAQILGIVKPDFPEFEPPHFRRGAISLAAESMGLTPEQFKQHMAQTAAEAMLQKAQHAMQKPAAPPIEHAIGRRRRRVV